MEELVAKARALVSSHSTPLLHSEIAAFIKAAKDDTPLEDLNSTWAKIEEHWNSLFGTSEARAMLDRDLHAFAWTFQTVVVIDYGLYSQQALYALPLRLCMMHRGSADEQRYAAQQIAHNSLSDLEAQYERRVKRTARELLIDQDHIETRVAAAVKPMRLLPSLATDSERYELVRHDRAMVQIIADTVTSTREAPDAAFPAMKKFIASLQTPTSPVTGAPLDNASSEPPSAQNDDRLETSPVMSSGHGQLRFRPVSGQAQMD